MSDVVCMKNTDHRYDCDDLQAQLADLQDRFDTLQTELWTDNKEITSLEQELALERANAEQRRKEISLDAKEMGRLKEIIVRFKALCKITGKGPIDKDCEMVRQLQAELATAKEANERLRGEIEWLCIELLRIQQISVTLFEVKDRAKRILEQVKPITLPEGD